MSERAPSSSNGRPNHPIPSRSNSRTSPNEIKRLKIDGGDSDTGADVDATDSIVNVQTMMFKMSEEGRRIFLYGVFQALDYDELENASFMLTDVKNEKATELRKIRDPFALMPDHIIRSILLNLDPVSLCHSIRVSRLWRRYCEDALLWKSLCHLSSQYRLTNIDAERSQIARFTNNGGIRWKSAFTERYKLWKNWHAGRCVVRTFTGHTQGVSCVQFDDKRIVSGSSDNTIRIWDLRRDHPLGQMTLNGHSATVRCLHLLGNILASGSNDFSIKVWNLDMNTQWSSIACRRTLMGHNNYVRCLQMDSQSLVSGSYDTSLRQWSLETGDCIKTFTGHTDAVLCLQNVPDDNRCVSGSVDNSIKIWDTRTARCEMTFHNAHESAVTCVRFDSQRIVSGSIDRMIKMWDIRNGRCLHTIDWRSAEGHTGVVRCLQTDSWRIVSAADDRTIKVWKLDSGERICTLQSHTDGVTCVQFDDNNIVSGSYDKTVKLWDFSV